MAQVLGDRGSEDPLTADPMPGMEVIESYAWPEELSTSGVQTSTLTLTFRNRCLRGCRGSA